MNQKHKNTNGGGYGVTSWFPQALIDDVKDTAEKTGQKPSFVIAEATRFGLSSVRRKYTQEPAGPAAKASKKTAKNGKR